MKKRIQILASALLICLCLSSGLPVLAGGLEFADREQLEDPEAVDVIVTMELMFPYEDMSFGPQNVPTREETAAIMSRLANAGDEVSDLYATAGKFVDVSQNRWSAKYIAYCAKTGMLQHLSRTHFNPMGKVTGYDVLPMLMTVVGFDSEEMGYCGDGWQETVLKDAKKVGLLRGFAPAFDWNQPLTREQLARLILNALECDAAIGVVEYDDDFWEDDVADELWQAVHDRRCWMMLGRNGYVIISHTKLHEALYYDKLKKTVDQDGSITWWYKTSAGSAYQIGTYPAVS